MSADPLPVLLVPGLLCSPLFYGAQLGPLWQRAPVSFARHTLDDSMAGIARRILLAAPPRFALAGHSMGGYIAFEMLRQAPQRVAKLALLDTAATPDTPQQTEMRHRLIQLARDGKLSQVQDQLWPLWVHAAFKDDARLRGIARQMAGQVGAEAFVRQQNAIMRRPDSRPGLAAIACPTLVLVGDADQLTPPVRSEEIAAAVPGARLVVLEDCGHMCAMERPDETTAALLDWLAT